MSNKVLISNQQKAVKVPSGMRILIRRACNAVLKYEGFEGNAEVSVTFVDMDTLLSTCDIVSLHVPQTPATVGLIGK